jgi:hypothetical protein
LQLTFILLKMIESNQPEHRQAADEDFLKSLNQLENILQENPLIEEEIAPVEDKSNIPVPEPEPKIDLAAWEDAVADIEQFLQSRE